MKTTRPAKPNSSAFTLAETLIASAIVSTALLGVIGLLSSDLNLARKNTTSSVAPTLAKRVAAEVALENAKTSLAATVVPPLAHPLKLYDAALRPVTQPAGTSRITSLVVLTVTVTPAVTLPALKTHTHCACRTWNDV